MLQDMSSVASSALVGALVEANLDELSNINSRRFAEAEGFSFVFSASALSSPLKMP